MSIPDTKEAFARLMALPDEQIDLGLAALLVAGIEYPDLDVGQWLFALDEMGDQARAYLGQRNSAPATIEAFSQFFAGQLGFHGNREDYYDPRNSFLNDVIERRMGIPITLTVVYVEIGRRAGLRLEGVAFPAHFLAKYLPPEGPQIIVDPFDRGAILSREACEQRLAALSNGALVFNPRYLETAPTKQILVRMLNNLKQIYIASHYFRKAIGIIDRMLAIQPAACVELRDRGMMHFQLRQFARARADLEAFLKLTARADEGAAAREALREIQDILTLMDA